MDMDLLNMDVSIDEDRNDVSRPRPSGSCSNGAEADCTPATSPKKKRKKQSNKESTEDWKKHSEVWKHFTEFTDKKGKRRGKSKYCGKDYAANPIVNGTSGLNNHLKTCKKNPERLSDNYAIHSYTQSVDLRDMSSHTSAPSKFDQESTREACARMIIIDELPFRFVEGEGFRHFVFVACPHFAVPSRTTVARNCFKLYYDEKNKLKAYFKHSRKRICLTTDTWTSNQRINYMCLTAHFIDDNWKLQKLILNFVPCSSHKGEDVGLLIEKCLLDWGIDNIFTITVDDASSNDTTVAYLRRRFVAWKKAICDGKYLHMRCVAHILNLIVKEGLTYGGVSVDRVCIVVRYLRQSPARWKKFKEYAVEEQVTSKKLLSLDCPTRWNSCYFMLETALLFKNVFDRYEIYEKDLRDDFGPQGPYGKIGLPRSNDWFVIDRLVKVLKYFYETTLRISGSKFVTSNVFLDEISDINALINKWKAKREDDPQLAKIAEQMEIKYNKYWGEPLKMNMLLFVVVVLDPRRKLKYVLFTINQMYSGELAKNMCDQVNKSLEEIFEEALYGLAKSSSESNSQSSSAINGTGDSTDIANEMLVVRALRLAEYRKICRDEEGDSENQSELDTYLSEKKEKDVLDFDVLGWWKMNTHRFPVLSMLARDLLALPISTVASESTFSTLGRVIDDFRASLTPRMAQALVCAQYWLRNGPAKSSVEEDYAQNEKNEEDVISSIGVDSVVIGL